MKITIFKAAKKYNVSELKIHSLIRQNKIKIYIIKPFIYSNNRIVTVDMIELESIMKI